jgi:hypothetical protein
MTSEQAQGLRIARALVANGIPLADALANPALRADVRDFVRGIFELEQTRRLRPVSTISADPTRGRWLDTVDRGSWYYWPTLRDYLISKQWNTADLDDETDRVLRQVANPSLPQFDIRGLVLGYVQSGKTANFTALIAKAVDVGYRLVIVLSGTDNGLRRQTQIRLNRELVGYVDNRPGAVPLPPPGKQWHQFTSEDAGGDFDAGRANYASLQGSEPVLIVMKKNGPRLRRLHAWLDEAPSTVMQQLPVLVVDDEADQASPDSKGDRVTQAPDPDDVIEDPSIINGLIRQLLRRFSRCSYAAYTATPFANILIPHDNQFHPEFGNDLYPKDFVIALPKRDGYFGAEELYGRFDLATGSERSGLDVIRSVGDEDLLALDQGAFPPSLQIALENFVLAGAGRRQRGQGAEPATMLIHTSSRRDDHMRLTTQVRDRLRDLRDEWRYQRAHVEPRLRARWDTEFRPITHAVAPSLDVSFDDLIEHVGPFLEAAREVREVNSRKGDMLDYASEPALKVIAVGGNRLSRGLTLEGLLVSYFVRRTVMYDTLMQMGRWFGYRGGWADLTRIYTTPELRSWFHDLATVEYQLREDIAVYERQGIKPVELGMRILSHPAMLVTSPLKQRHSSTINVAQTYAAKVVQSFKFPFARPADLADQADANLALTREFLGGLGAPDWREDGPIWTGTKAASGELVVDFLKRFRIDETARSVSLPLLCAYLERQIEQEELVHWTIAVKGRKRLDATLGEAVWSVAGGQIAQIGRTRLKSDPASLGVVTEPGDEESGLSEELLERAHALAQEKELGQNPAARLVRPATDGLLLLYPISRQSGHDLPADSQSRQRLFDPSDQHARDLIAFALSFPPSSRAPTIFGQGALDYVTGTVEWRPVE